MKKGRSKKPVLLEGLCICKHQFEAHIAGECVVCGCQTFVADIRHKDENQLQQMLDWRVAENLREAKKPCPHIRGETKMDCYDCFQEYFFVRTVRN